MFFITGNASFAGTLTIDIRNNTSFKPNDRVVIGHIGNLARPFDLVNILSVDPCIDSKSKLDYRESDLSLGVLLHARGKCRSNRKWLIPLIVFGMVL